MLHDKYMKNGPQAGSGFILPKSGKTLQWWLGAGLVYAGLGAPGAGKVIREIAAIIDKPQYFAKVVSMGVGGVLVLSASS